MEKNKDNTAAIERFLSWLDDYEHRSSFEVFSDKLDEAGQSLCWHYTKTKNGKTRFHFVDYEPTPNELNKIRSHRFFSGFDRIDSIKICTLCGVIRVQNKETK